MMWILYMYRQLVGYIGTEDLVFRPFLISFRAQVQARDFSFHEYGPITDKKPGSILRIGLLVHMGCK
jgi:hypothetical protein